MKYLSLHKTTEDYSNLVLNESNTPHISYIIETKGLNYIRKKSQDHDGYRLFNAADGEFLDKDNNQIYVK